MLELPREARRHGLKSVRETQLLRWTASPLLASLRWRNTRRGRSQERGFFVAERLSFERPIARAESL